MPEFKLNGKTYSGSTSYASAIDYTEADGSKTTVQDKISEMDNNLELSKGSLEIYGTSTIINDCNNAEVGSMYFVYPSAINSPFADGMASLITAGVENEKNQFAFGNTKIAVRFFKNGTWSSWVTK